MYPGSIPGEASNIFNILSLLFKAVSRKGKRLGEMQAWPFRVDLRDGCLTPVAVFYAALRTSLESAPARD
ncbi:hypothetical protein NOF55_10580 [Rhizobiaceae bacterium BDR2-2]|uniref:Uncharacterized protein n=1 Tax=Ectorhizobium quercum TaxID=2965071 RepID=A0AAE3SUX8_9HYPH|nr:hypothetical protein [Ectorhizobium quercum]MCX8997552.1 hypothetical protein [Ectorhizobium quercum]